MKASVYYHVWAPYNDPLVYFLVDEQLKRLELHSLTNQCAVNVCVVGSAAEDIAGHINRKDYISIRKVVTEDDGWELHTIKVLQEDCKKNDDLNVMYMHTKGLSHYYNVDKNPVFSENVNTWRHFMEMVCIDRWRECLTTLRDFDAVGMNLMSKPFTHFSGNFWWSKASHIVKLRDPFENYQERPKNGFKSLTGRHNAEEWVCSQPGKYKSLCQVHGSMYSSGKYSQYKTMLHSL